MKFLHNSWVDKWLSSLHDSYCPVCVFRGKTTSHSFSKRISLLANSIFFLCKAGLKKWHTGNPEVNSHGLIKANAIQNSSVLSASVELLLCSTWQCKSLLRVQE